MNGKEEKSENSYNNKTKAKNITKTTQHWKRLKTVGDDELH